MLASTVHGQSRDRDIQAIPGSPPDMRSLPPGCSFLPRCAAAVPACGAAMPAPRPVGPGHEVRCIRAGESEADIKRALAGCA
jgi:peptide/nickel transport system ATP-binding protein